ncbi:MAG: hypothetical protein ACODAE_07740 [Gemmatimonadota bacterium]
MADRSNPFGDEPVNRRERRDPFGEAPPAVEGAVDAANRIEQAARKIRGLRSRLGAEGLTPAATRELIDEIAAAFDAAARGLRGAPDED